MRGRGNAKIIAILIMVLAGQLTCIKNSFAVPAPYDLLHTLTQPDGATFSARQWGDERMNGWETADGYTIIQDLQSYWTYAMLSPVGKLISSVLIVGKDDPVELGLPTKLRDIEPLTETGQNPIFLVNFADTRPLTTVASFNASWFHADAAVPIVDWFTVAHPLAFYGEDVRDAQGRRLYDRNVAALVIETIKAADGAIDFRRYDADGNCYVDWVIVVHQGAAQEETKNSNDLFSLPGSLNAAKEHGDGTGEISTNDRCNPENFTKVNAFIIQPEIRAIQK